MYPIIYHGSENSRDIDAYIIVPEKRTFSESKKLCESYDKLNANLLVIKDGRVDWCYKGTVDECNNSILATYSLHKQHFENPVKEQVDRSYAQKLIRTVRGLLSYNSRTELRKSIKEALKNPDFHSKLNVLKSIDLEAINDFKKASTVETYKFFAFQLGQTLALLDENIELFTKNQVSAHYPDLKKYLDREEGASPKDLQNFWNRFIDFCFETTRQVEKHDFYASDYNGKREVFDCKSERILPPVIVFDIDNTLMDESHRAYLREAEKWDEYFELCHEDKPIQHIIDLTKHYKNKGYEIWIMSGRSENVLEKTIESLENNGAVYDYIKLRHKENFMPDYVLKPAWVRNHIGLERVEVIYDDSKEVIEGFRKKGLNVIDVNTLHQQQDKVRQNKPS